MTKQYSILIEQDKAEGNFSGYIPAFRLGVVGESAEEVIGCAMDLLNAEIEKYKVAGKPFPEDTTIIETIEINLGRNLV